MLFPTEAAVKNYMSSNNMTKAELYITAYVDDSGYQSWGFSFENINSDYYFNQKSISSKTKTFSLE